VKSSKRGGKRPVRKVGPVAPQGWGLEHSPFTPEGEIEAAGRLARGMAYASPRRRLAARVFVIVFCGPFVVALIVAAVTFVRAVAG
jgi:hypothetical protein